MTFHSDKCLENKAVSFSCLTGGKWAAVPKLSIKCAAPATTKPATTTTIKKWTTSKTTIRPTTRTFKPVVTPKPIVVTTTNVMA